MKGSIRSEAGRSSGELAAIPRETMLGFMPRLTARQQTYLNVLGIDYWVVRQRSPGPGSIGEEAELITEAPAGVEPGHAAATGTQVDWEELQQLVSACTRCDLHVTRKNTVFGTGDTSAKWMFVGEAPGPEEDRQGLPFVRRAGQQVNAMLSAFGLTREQVYIANVLKCRPPNNRDPMGQEVRQCEPYLHRQVSYIGPKLIVALGRFAAQSLLKTTRPISKLRDETFTYDGIPLIVTYHPAYLLRNPIDKRKAWADLCRAKQLLERGQ